MEHKYLQPLQFPKNTENLSGKTDTMSSLLTYISENKSSFKNGEEITIRYNDNEGKVASSVVVINKMVENEISISTTIGEDDSMKIVDSETEPEGDNTLWIRDTSGITPEEIQADIKSLNALVKQLSILVSKHEYAFTTIMDAGDLETNSTRKSLMDTAAPINPTGDTVTYSEVGEEIEPDYEDYKLPNLRSLCIKGAANEETIKANIKNINERELILCESNLSLYSKLNGNLIKISGSGGGTDTGKTEDIMSGITQSGDSIASIRFVNSKGTKYIVKVDENGKLVTYNEIIDQKHAAPTSGTPGQYVNQLFEPKLYINMVYCGGTDSENNNVEINEHSNNYCSHNFVELSNLTGADVNLSGLTLQYCASDKEWKHSLKLKGIIKNGSTFLIRGAQCSVMDANTTIIKVDKYDMEWNITETSEGKEITKPIQFSNKAAAFYLCYDSGIGTPDNPWKSGTPNTVYYGYIDLVGLSDGSSTIFAFESGATKNLNSNRILTKYYTMDPVSQATKDLTKRNNSADWQYVELNKSGIIPNVLDYTPKASSENKNIFFNKTKLLEDKPTIVTCSFGIQATDNGSGATRCFNWVSKDYYEEAVWIYSGNTLITSGISINNEPQFIESVLNPKFYYNRIRMEATSGEYFTVHKQVIKELSAGTYEYIVGRCNISKVGETTIATPIEGHCTERRKFIVRTDTVVNSGFEFIQSSDQQGFNWDEYQLWKYTGKNIKDENQNVHFMINTGDMTQNGNRLNEWIDYFNAKEYINDLEEMATVGNNDLCSSDVYAMGNGGDASKINPSNILLFYTFELDPDNMPVFDIQIGTQTTHRVYVPSLYSFNYGKIHFMCINSEITKETEKSVFKLKGIGSEGGYVYIKVKEWMTKDIAFYGKNGSKMKSNWRIAFCHENPFTIMTQDLMTSFFNGSDEISSKYRGGSHLNTVALNDTVNGYWYSTFCQDPNNDIRLCICGHKHTQATTWPIKEYWEENSTSHVVEVVSFKPIIQLTQNDLETYFDGSKGITKVSTDLKHKTETHEKYIINFSYPNSWFDWVYVSGDTPSVEESLYVIKESKPSPIHDKDEHVKVGEVYYDLKADKINSNFIFPSHFCQFEIVSAITAPVYAMSQSSGYKHTSNKELPCYNIPWERYYYPTEKDKQTTANAGQKYPFYTKWNIKEEKITGTVKKVAGIFNKSGKFNINVEGENVKKGISNHQDPWGSTIHSINGLTLGIDKTEKDKSEDNWTKIVINK